MNYESLYWQPCSLEQPTPEECQSNAQVPLSEPYQSDQRGYACWYPQISRSIVVDRDSRAQARS